MNEKSTKTVRNMINAGIERDANNTVLIGVFNSGYLIALLLFLAGSIGSLCDGVIASRGLGVAELAAIGIVYPYTKTMECISLLFSSGSQVVMGRKIGQNRFDEVSKVFYTSLSFIAVLAVLLAVFVCVCSDPISRLARVVLIHRHTTGYAHPLCEKNIDTVFLAQGNMSAYFYGHGNLSSN